MVLVLWSDTGEEGCEKSKVLSEGSSQTSEEERQVKFSGKYNVSDEGKLLQVGGERSVDMD